MPAARQSLPQNAGANHEAFAAGNRSAAGERNGLANTPSWDNRVNAGNRANLGNGAYVANRPINGNNFAGQAHANFNGGNVNGGNFNGGNYNHGNWYHGNWNGNWNNGWNNYQPLGWGGGGYWAGAAFSAVPWSWGYYPYDNPYYGGATVDDGSMINYSQPIVVAQPVAAVAGAPTAEQQSTPLFDAARTAFMQGDYKTALAQVDQAIALVPNDTALHEFRGLALFALGRYKEAAATDYAVLSAGPGWDWTTLSALYPNVDVYTEQLRALEQYTNLHPAASEARFLLAENYLTCGYTDSAIAQFKAVVQLNPKDQLSGQLLKSLATPNTAAPNSAEQEIASQPAAPAQPVNPSSLVGNWTATRADGAPIKLALGGDGKFTWALDQNGKPQQFSGTYSVADNLLVLKQGNNPMMAGQVVSLANNSFNFKLAGDNTGDPGLNFVR
jgi:tetratricopeptide (TPR) repeat protein